MARPARPAGRSGSTTGHQQLDAAGGGQTGLLLLGDTGEQLLDLCDRQARVQTLSNGHGIGQSTSTPPRPRQSDESAVLRILQTMAVLGAV